MDPNFFTEDEFIEYMNRRKRIEKLRLEFDRRQADRDHKVKVFQLFMSACILIIVLAGIIATLLP